MRRTNALIALLACAIPAFAQSTKLEFDAATVKPAAPLTGRGTPRGGPGPVDPERVNYTYVSMKNLLMAAYSLPINQIIGPDWIDSDRYAKVPPGVTKEQVNVMLQNLLADRFKLVVHREAREMPLYELVVAKSGLKMKPYVEDPNAPKPEPGKINFDKNGNPIVPPGTLTMSSSPGKRRVTATKAVIGGSPGLSTTLAAELGRPVVDKAGLSGFYDYSIEFRPQGPNAVPPGQQPPPPSDSDAPDIVTAVQEQLGLRLEAKKGPIEVAVVDGGNKTPTEN